MQPLLSRASQDADPTLRAAATRARVSAQRISDWRNGRHLPRDFATVEPLLVWLTARAVAAGADALVAGSFVFKGGAEAYASNIAALKAQAPA